MSHLTPVPSDPDELRRWLDALGEQAVGRVFEAFRNQPITLPARPDAPVSLTVKVTLKGAKPPIWRRLRLPGDLTLDAVHDVLQEAMGWTDSHLHQFRLGNSPRDPHFLTDYDLEEGDDGTPEREAHLDQLLRAPGDRLFYAYDFGDGWEHELRLEEVGPAGDGDRPTCLAGARACPPEDVGGIGAYEDLMAWHRAGRTADALPAPFEWVDQALAWLPLGWDPETFDVEETDRLLLAQHQAGDVLDRVRPAAIASFLRLGTGQENIAAWLGAAAQQAPLTDDDLDDLTAPWRALLTVLGSPVQLSKAGWLPAEVVAELCDVLEIDPLLAGKANRESNVRPLAAFRKVAMQVGLLHTSHDVLMPTVKGMQLRDDPARLWSHLASRLPPGRSEISQDVGWFTILVLAGGADHDDVYDEVHRLLVNAGWVTGPGTELDRWETPPLVWPTLDALVGPRRMDMGPYPHWIGSAAADLLLARQPAG